VHNTSAATTLAELEELLAGSPSARRPPITRVAFAALRGANRITEGKRPRRCDRSASSSAG
jgi:hypothetical protein